MSRRHVIAGLVVLATIGFVVGTTIERGSGETSAERAAPVHAEGGEAGERPAVHAAEGGAAQTHGEFRPFGVDTEAVVFVVLASLASLAVALAVLTRSRSLAVLGAAIAVLALFAVLDVREVLHQADEHRTGLAVLAAVVALLHAAAAAIAASACGRRERPRTASPGGA